MKTIVLIVIALLVITLLVLAFHKKKTKPAKTATRRYSVHAVGLQSVTPYTPTSREYDYSRRENLVEQSDTKYTVPTQEVQQIELTRSAVEHATSRAKAVIHINQAFFNKLKNTYAQAYILYMNGNAANAKRRDYRYLKSLYYRSVEAGARLQGVPAGSVSASAQQQRGKDADRFCCKVPVHDCQAANQRLEKYPHPQALHPQLRCGGKSLVRGPGTEAQGKIRQVIHLPQIQTGGVLHARRALPVFLNLPVSSGIPPWYTNLRNNGLPEIRPERISPPKERNFYEKDEKVQKNHAAVKGHSVHSRKSEI